jgi:hypothetical protein
VTSFEEIPREETTMKTTLTIVAAIAAVTTAATADARPNSPAEQRGYQACLEANQDAFRSLIPERHYLINETDGPSPAKPTGGAVCRSTGAPPTPITHRC